MTDNCKIISVTAKQPVVTVPNGAKVATAEAKEVITRVESVQLAPPSPDVCYESRLTGMGEEWIPDPHLFKYLETEFSLNDYIKSHVFKALNEQAATSETRFSNVVKVLATSTDASDIFVSYSIKSVCVFLSILIGNTASKMAVSCSHSLG